MTRTQVLEAIRAALQDDENPSELIVALTEETLIRDLFEQLEIDSLDWVVMLMEVEKAFQIKLPEGQDLEIYDNRRANIGNLVSWILESAQPAPAQ